MDNKGHRIDSDLICTEGIAELISEIDQNNCDLYIKVQLKGLSFNTFIIE